MYRDRLTAKERMKAIKLKKRPDRVPVIPHMEVYAARICNMSARDYYLNPEMAFEAQRWAKDLHQHDGGIGYGIPEKYAWDFGGEIEFPTSTNKFFPRVIKRPITCAADIEKLKVPSIDNAPGASRNLQHARMCFEQGMGVGVSAGSPMSVVHCLTGSDLLMRWLIKEPELVHRLLRIATDYLISTAERYVEEFGAGNVKAGCSCPMECHAIMSPKTFEKYSLIYIKEIFDKFAHMGINIKTVHLCGNHTKNLSYWKDEIKVHPRTLFTVGYEMDIEHLAKELGEEHMVGGNLRNSILQTGSPREVYEEAGKIVEKMKYTPGGFILTPDCNLSPITPAANVHAMIQAARDFGKYE